MEDTRATTCDWCSREAPVQTIRERLWRFWKIISSEDPMLASRRSVCEKCKSRLEGFSVYIETCKAHAFVVEEILDRRWVTKEEPAIDIEHHPLTKEEGKELPEDKSSLSCAASFKCSHCDKAYTWLSTLKAHMHIHTGEKRLKCSVCNKTFSRSYSLKEHTRIHTGEKPFACPVCDKTFARSRDLNSHVRVHTGEKPFECSVCDRTFAWSSDLNKHMPLHTGWKGRLSVPSVVRLSPSPAF